MSALIDKVKGQIKQTAGALSGDKRPERQREVDEANGDARGAVANLKRAVKEAARKWRLKRASIAWATRQSTFRPLNTDTNHAQHSYRR